MRYAHNVPKGLPPRSHDIRMSPPCAAIESHGFHDTCGLPTSQGLRITPQSSWNQLDAREPCDMPTMCLRVSPLARTIFALAPHAQILSPMASMIRVASPPHRDLESRLKVHGTN